MGPIILFTDFGVTGPYVGQLHGRLAALAPAARVVDLMHDAARFAPRPAAYLLASLAPEFAPGAVFVCVVDPGVGTRRRPLLVQADGRWFVGPDNGLLEVVAAQARGFESWEIVWRPSRLSATFHGRDLFAPMAAALVGGAWESRVEQTRWQPGLPDDLSEVIYIDAFGNAVTGLRSDGLGRVETLRCREREFARAETFADVAVGQPLWYVNSNGLAELAINQGNAAERLGIAVGEPVRFG